MTAYYVSKLGNDSNAGTSAAAAFLTIGAAEDAATSAGDIVYVAPGTYRERVTNGSSGADGNPITFEADPNSRHFGATVEPGQVRVTGCDANEFPEGDHGDSTQGGSVSTSAIWIMNAQTNVTIRGFLIDGSTSDDMYEGCLTGGTPTGEVDFGYEGQLVENCMFNAADTAIYGVRLVSRCFVATGANGIYRCGYVTDCLVMGTSYLYAANYRVIGCVGVGGYYAFSTNDACFHCTAYFSLRGFYTRYASEEYVLSCAAFYCTTGFQGYALGGAYMSPGRCFAGACYTGYHYVQGNNATNNTDTYTEDAWGEPTYWGDCRNDYGTHDSSGADEFDTGIRERETPLLYMSNMLEILSALKLPFSPGKLGIPGLPGSRAYGLNDATYDLYGYAGADDFDKPGQWRYGHPSGSWDGIGPTATGRNRHHSGSGVGTDILGHNIFTGDHDTVSGSAASPALDIGAFAMSKVFLTQSSDFYKNVSPGIVIFGGGEKRIGLIVSGGNSITASMYVSCSKSGASDASAPFLVLSGSPFFYSSLTAASEGDLIDRGSSWSDGGFQKLTVKGHVSKTERISLVLSGHQLVTSSFSDLLVK